MFSDNKLVIVTAPDYYHSDSPSVMLYDVVPSDIKLINEILLSADIHVSVHLAYSHKSPMEWVINTAKMVDRAIVNLEKHDLVKGFILNYPNVSYYNGHNDLKSLNTNEIFDPVEYVMRLVNERK